MNEQRDPLILADAALIARYALLVATGLFLVAGIAGAGFLVTYFALFVIFSLGLSFALLYHNVRGTRLKRVMPNNRALEKALAMVQVKVHNTTPFTCLLSQLEDRFPPAGRERQLMGIGKPLLPYTDYDIPVEHECQGKRGRYTVGPLRLIAYDPFGMFTLACADEERYDFYIYPPIIPLSDVTLSGLAKQFTFGVYESRRLGPGYDFAGIREYRDRDDCRAVHWPATARTGKLMMREFEQIGSLQVSIFFDLSKASLAGIGPHSTGEYAIKLASSLAHLAIEEGHQVQMLAEGDRLIYQPLAGGMRHFTEIMQELASVRPEGKRPLGELIDAYLDLVPEQSHAIIIFSKCDIEIEHYLEALRMLRGRQIRVTAILIDHTTFLPVYELHHYTLSAEAHETLMQQGVSVFVVRSGDDLAQALSLPLIVEESA